MALRLSADAPHCALPVNASMHPVLELDGLIVVFGRYKSNHDCVKRMFFDFCETSGFTPSRSGDFARSRA